MQYLIDTDWSIDYLRGLPRMKAPVEERLPMGMGLSILSYAELYEGILYSDNSGRRREMLNRLLASVDIVGIDEETCRIFARERGRLRAGGAIIGDIDLFIAATAIQHDLTLLTNNRRHFTRISGLKIISV